MQSWAKILNIKTTVIEHTQRQRIKVQNIISNNERDSEKFGMRVGGYFFEFECDEKKEPARPGLWLILEFGLKDTWNETNSLLGHFGNFFSNHADCKAATLGYFCSCKYFANWTNLNKSENFKGRERLIVERNSRDWFPTKFEEYLQTDVLTKKSSRLWFVVVVFVTVFRFLGLVVLQLRLEHHLLKSDEKPQLTRSRS